VASTIDLLVHRRRSATLDTLGGLPWIWRDFLREKRVAAKVDALHAIARLDLEQPVDQGAELAGRPLGKLDAWRLVCPQNLLQRLNAAGFERRPGCEALVEDGACAPQIRLFIVPF
jgi:hypothetical protein